MGKKNLILIIAAEQGYIRNLDSTVDFSVQNDLLFSAISDTYLPLLNLFTELENETISFKIGMVLPATLCTLLEDEAIQQQYIDWLDRRIALGERELERTAQDAAMHDNARRCLNRARHNKTDFIDVYKRRLVPAFRHFARRGFLELIATAATSAFLPHYADLTEALNAQIETGLYSQRHFFGELGEGFFLPSLGYAKGLDKVLRSYGINYTVLDTPAFLFAKKPPETGIFSPVRSEHSLVLFGADYDMPSCLTGEGGFAKNSVYRAQQEDISFDLPKEELSAFLGNGTARVQSGYKYWANGSNELERQPYNTMAALTQVKFDALDFYHAKRQELEQARQLQNGNDVTLTCVIPAEVMGQTWHEGVDWLEHVIRIIAQDKDITLEHCKNLISGQFTMPKMKPYPCAASGTGYGEDLLDSSNCWMLRYVRKASERMIDLTERFPSETGLKARLLNLGAREVLMAQSGSWPRLLHDGRLPDYATAQFKLNILSFTTVFDSLASNIISTEWLTNLEKDHAIFPWLNYRVFSRKK